MQLEENDLEKRVSIWLTHAESENEKLKESLRPIYKEYKAKKYLVAVYESGTESLEGSIRDLVLYNRVRLREMEKPKKKREYCR